MMQINHQNYRQRGVALVLVLWLLALLIVIVSGYNTTMRTETVLAAHQLKAAQARALAESGIWLGTSELLKPAVEQIWKTDGTSYSTQYGEGEIQIQLFDENGKIDLNTARVELLHGLLKTTGLSDEESLRLLQSILDWRDRDNLKRQFGAEDDDYENNGYDYGAKDGPFNSVGELRLVMGMTEPVFQKIFPALTVHSHQPGINPDVAPKKVLQAIPGMDDTQIEDFLSERNLNIGNSASPPISGIDNRFFSRARSRIFTVTSEGNIEDSKMRIDAVIMLKANATPPYSVLSWRESQPRFQENNNDDEPNTDAITDVEEYAD